MNRHARGRRIARLRIVQLSGAIFRVLSNCLVRCLLFVSEITDYGRFRKALSRASSKSSSSGWLAGSPSAPSNLACRMTGSKNAGHCADLRMPATVPTGTQTTIKSDKARDKDDCLFLSPIYHLIEPKA